MNINKLEKLLSTKKITQKEFAIQIGVSENTVSSWISGKSDSISSINLEKICKELNIPVGYFFDDFSDSMVNESTEKYGNHTVRIGRDNNGTVHTLTEAKHEIDYLKKIIIEKDKIINEKERTIQILIKQNQ